MRGLLAVLALVASAAIAAAHQLTVFASVAEGQVLVETRFSNGNRPQLGDVRVLDSENQQVLTLELGEDGTVQFPLDPAHADTGLLIEVTTSGGHSNYWILTPEDIARGAGG